MVSKNTKKYEKVRSIKSTDLPPPPIVHIYPSPHVDPLIFRTFLSKCKKNDCYFSSFTQKVAYYTCYSASFLLSI